MNPRRGVTLIEVLISMTMMVFLLTTATVALTQVKTTTRRIQARQALHNTASIIHERLRYEFDAMMDVGALWLRSDTAGGGKLELIFLRGKLDHLDFQLENNAGYYAFAQTDLVWTRWAYLGSTKTIEVAESTPRRLHQLTTNWIRHGFNSQNSWFAHLPTPVRSAAENPEIVLERTAFQNGAPEDFGDYQDLLKNARAIAIHCTEMTWEMVRVNGSSVAVGTEATTTVRADGNRIDGRDAAAAAARPALMRLRFTLHDPMTRLEETFSFSFRTPNLLLAQP